LISKILVRSDQDSYFQSFSFFRKEHENKDKNIWEKTSVGHQKTHKDILESKERERERERERTKKNEKENKNVWTYVIHTKVETENDRSRIVPLVSLPTCKGLPTLTRDKQVTRGEGGEGREERGHGGADHT
jgi:hypothetical protein